MCARIFSRGFRGRRQDGGERDRLPPGQYLVHDFPVLSAGPTPRMPLDRWDFSIVQEGADSGLVTLGHDPVRIRTERFGPTGR